MSSAKNLEQSKQSLKGIKLENVHFLILILVYKQKNRSMEQNRVSRNGPTHIRSIYFDKGLSHSIGKEKFFSTMLLEYLGIYKQKINFSLNFILYTKINLRWILDTKVNRNFQAKNQKNFFVIFWQVNNYEDIKSIIKRKH